MLILFQGRRIVHQDDLLEPSEPRGQGGSPNLVRLINPVPSQGADYTLNSTNHSPPRIFRPSYGPIGYDDIALLLPRLIFKSTVQRIICIFTVCEFGSFVGLHCQNNILK